MLSFVYPVLYVILQKEKTKVTKTKFMNFILKKSFELLIMVFRFWL